MNTRRRLILGALGATGVLPWTRSIAREQNWPKQPIRMILPYSAGGPTDVVARAVAATMSRNLHQPFIVENRTGASGNIACENVARAEPDGYTLLYHSSGLAISPSLYRAPGYDPIRDFAPVGLTASIPLVLMVNNDLPVRDISEFVAHLNAHPGKLSYGTGGIGNITDLAVALFLQRKALKALAVPYKGTAPALIAMMGNQVQFMVDAVNSALPHIQAGKVRALAVTSPQRTPVLSEVPTLAESVAPGFAASTWQGILAPRRTPPAIIDAVNASMVAAIEQDGALKPFIDQGVEPRSSTPLAFATYLAEEIERWRQAATAAGIEPQ